MTTRALITGLGAVTPFGIGVPALWDGLCAGRSAIGPITLFDACDLPVRIAGEVRDFRPGDHMDGKTARRTDRFTQFALVAVDEALSHARLALESIDPGRVATLIYTGAGGMATMERAIGTRIQRGGSAVSALTIPLWAPNMGSAMNNLMRGLTGPAITGTAACAAGVMAVVDAVRTIELGLADVVIAGASEALLTPIMMAGFAATGALSTRNDDPAGACRPFATDRDGTVLSEGACALIVESEAHAVRRGATALAVAAGGATTSDAYHITKPDPSGRHVARAIRQAIERAGLGLEEIDYYSAHGTGSELGDLAETAALHLAFGERVRRLQISSTKSTAGHLVGAAGALASLSCVLSIRDGIVPPTINLERPDPRCDLDYTPLKAIRKIVRAAVANGIAFGGQNAAAVFRAV